MEACHSTCNNSAPAVHQLVAGAAYRIFESNSAIKSETPAREFGMYPLSLQNKVSFESWTDVAASYLLLLKSRYCSVCTPCNPLTFTVCCVNIVLCCVMYQQARHIKQTSKDSECIVPETRLFLISSDLIPFAPPRMEITCEVTLSNDSLQKGRQVLTSAVTKASLVSSPLMSQPCKHKGITVVS